MQQDPVPRPRLTEQPPPPAGPSTVEAEPSVVLFGAGFPPIPTKLVTKIQEGNFVDMHELLPERLGATEDNEQSRPAKSKGRMVTEILEWVRCFGLYVAIISCSAPNRVPDLLGYQALILDAQKEYPGDHWIGYDRRFRQRAAATRSTNWSAVEPTLWNMAFAGRASTPRCKFCFSVSHLSSNCELGSETHVPTRGIPSHPHSSFTYRRPICYDWNEDPAPGCPRKAADLNTYAICAPRMLL